MTPIKYRCKIPVRVDEGGRPVSGATNYRWYMTIRDHHEVRQANHTGKTVVIAHGNVLLSKSQRDRLTYPLHRSPLVPPISSGYRRIELTVWPLTNGNGLTAIGYEYVDVEM